MTVKIVTDIETMSTRSDAAVIGIGIAVVVNDKIVDKTEVLIDPTEAAEYGHVDPGTFKWWAEQPTFAKAWAGEWGTDEAVEEIDGFLCSVIEQYGDEIEAWANPPSFDYTILRNLWRKLEREWPLSFRNERCFRTMFKFAETLGPIQRVAPEEPHMPLSDAISEAQTLINLEHFLNEFLDGGNDEPSPSDLPRSVHAVGEVPPDGDGERVPGSVEHPGSP